MKLDESIYWVEDLHSIDSPALLVYPELISANIDEAKRICGGALQPHVKTVKCLEILKLALSRGVERFKCSTISEAESLGIVGAREVLLNMQPNPIKAERLRNLIAQFPDTRFGCLVDNVMDAENLNARFSGLHVDVYMDVNLGMNRTGTSPARIAQLYFEIKDLPALNIRGLHGYEGHIDDENRELRAQRAQKALEQLLEVKKQIKVSADHELEVVIGGSPTFEFYLGEPNVYVSPGTFFLWDAGYGLQYPEIPFRPAAILLTRILSITTDQLMTLDLGYKAVASDGPLPRVVFPFVTNYEVQAQYEEHLIVKVPDTSKYIVGEEWLGVPMHICPTVNLFECMITVNHQVGTEWKVVARDRKITI